MIYSLITLAFILFSTVIINIRKKLEKEHEKQIQKQDAEELKLQLLEVFQQLKTKYKDFPEKHQEVLSLEHMIVSQELETSQLMMIQEMMEELER